MHQWSHESHIDIKASYIGVIIGGLIFGVGFAIAGYCPGTCLVGVGGGRKDALMFIVGGLVGATLFALSYGWLVTAFPAIFADLAGGEVTVASTGINEYSDLSGKLPALAVAGAIAVALMFGAWMLPKKFNC
ncbi:MAG: YeeE/YedE family protein [Verrucomicrobiales bacterium]|nr:YeeE/YedE family protein [Verrucomicrobiales bacterium]